MARLLDPRKTPRQVRSRATRDAIVEAAARIVGTRGLDGFTTNAVADRAGVSIGSLYQYFPNKDALMVALIAWQQARQAVALREAAAGIGPDASFADTVRALVRGAMAHHRADALLATAIDHEEARLPTGAVSEQASDEAAPLIVALLARYRDRIGAIDPNRAARTLPALVRAVVDTWANRDPPELDVAEDEAVRAVLGYLGARQDD